MGLLHVVLLSATLFVAKIHADVYLHNPPGSNNRLRSRNRDLNKKEQERLFDSQNNERGGYNVGGDGRSEGKGSLTYIGGSFLDIQWTNQHECGGKNTGCDIIIQYMCSDTLRDGTSSSKPDENRDKTRTGLHEDQAYYQACKNRARDTNLYHADQNLVKADARSTRQNPNGDRNGLECPEERDYYPYHAPSPWKDIAILTSNVDKCDDYKAQSQNVIHKGFCTGVKQGKQPIREELCKSNGGTWLKAPAHGIPAPKCLPAPKSRDNHNGNTESSDAGVSEDAIPRTLAYNWEIPDVDEVGCVLRVRYNISIGDYDPFGVDASKENKDKIVIGEQYGLSPTEAIARGYYIKNNPEIKPMKSVPNLDFQLALNTAQTGRTFEDRTHKFRITKRKNVKTLTAAAPVYNLNVIGKRGNIVQVYPAVEYGFEPAILSVNQGDYVMPQWTGSLRNNKNNDGQGRKGEDKSNIIAMTPRKYKVDQAPANTLGHSGNSYPLKITTGTFLGADKEMAAKLAFPTEEGNVELQVGEQVTFSPLGCYNDKRNRAINGGMTIFSPSTVIQQCAKKASRAGNQVFAVEYNKECFTSSNAKNTYDTHGVCRNGRCRRGRCRNGRGGNWAMNVYEITSATRKDEKIDPEMAGSTDSSDNKDNYYNKALKDITESLEKTEEKIEDILDAMEDEKEKEEELYDEKLIANDTYVDEDDDKPFVDAAFDDDDDEEIFGEREKRGNGNAAELDDAPATVSVGVIQANTCGTFNYLCTRNNNFSNRSQKGKVVVCS